MSGDPIDLDAIESRAFITSASRHDSAVVLSLSCGHAVLRRPNYAIPRDRLTDCDVCAAERGRALERARLRP